MDTVFLCIRTVGGIGTWLAGLVLLTILAATCGNDSVMQPVNEGNRISGRLMEAGKGVVGASVAIISEVGASTVATGDQGYFSVIVSDSGSFLVVPAAMGGHVFSPDTVRLDSVAADISVGIFTLMSGSGEIAMVQLQQGELAMGSSSGEVDEFPHNVTISSFRIGASEITWAQYFTVTGQSPGYFQGNDLLPMEGVSWWDAADFCNALSLLENLEPCYNPDGSCDYSGTGYRLPTEAEWEYACRAGTDTKYYFGDSDTLLNHYAVFSPFGVSTGLSLLVGETLEPNPWGMFDILGNVAEWCSDWYGSYPMDTDDVPLDPVGLEVGVFKVVRGGSWRYPEKSLRSANRDYRDPQGRYDDVGFRVVRRAGGGG